MQVDLNCDLGEGSGLDARLMPLITSANIACGGHAGDDTTMRVTAELAARFDVAVGAHPGFPDRPNFGRHELRMTEPELRGTLVDQIRALGRICRLRHVKPHGALYNLAARDAATARIVAGAIREVDSKLIVFALAGSQLVLAARSAGLRVAEEVFADRTYAPDGSLTPRDRPRALLDDEAQVSRQVLRVVRDGFVETTDGGRVPIKAETICLHGDGAHALEFARRIRRDLETAGISIRPIG